MNIFMSWHAKFMYFDAGSAEIKVGFLLNNGENGSRKRALLGTRVRNMLYGVLKADITEASLC